MYLLQPHLHTRRAFLRRAGQLAMTGTALPMALNLAALGEAAAFNVSPSDPNDYKALVCVFLYGGNDYANTVVTYDDPSYNQYSSIRGGGAGQSAGGIALAKSDLAATLLTPNVPLAGARQYALHPAMSGLAALFNAGRAAVQLNVGPLVVPLTRAQYNNSNRNAYPLPPKLFSHNDQQSIWQSSSPEGSTIGWGGNLGDLALSSNSNSLFTCISVTGNAVFLSGDSALAHQVSTSGAVAINGASRALYGSATAQAALRSLVTATRSHPFETESNRIVQRSIAAEGQITAALAGAPALTTTFDSTNALATQLKMVARLIGARAALGTTRQVFLVSLGGFDLHDNLVDNHPGLLAKVGGALKSFHDATVELGVAQQVTAFTASDFGRTLSINGDGSDHGWGSHHFVVGGAVKGQRFYGTAPAVAVNGPDDVGQGRLLPTTSVDQFAATLARWFGVAESDLPTVVPRIGNFATRDLGFL